MDKNFAVISRIVSRCEITYRNGMAQTKNLITHLDYDNIIKPIENKIYEIERLNRWKPTSESIKLKRDLFTMFGSDYFTDKSPLFEAIKTGILDLPKHQGGKIPCQVKLIH